MKGMIASNHYIVMVFIMILSGLLSTMNVWVDKLDDIRLSINDVYMISLMTGWMLFFMGLYYTETTIVLLGGIVVLAAFTCIRTQFLVSSEQFTLGMIPHHSMAVHMSKKLLEKGTPHTQFVKQIIRSQEEEIEQMKQFF
jgi:glucose-6-phosphate-specific signal transduction histidine kinase